jgi:hypothetical protein
MSGFLIVWGELHRPWRRIADDLNRMTAPKPIEALDSRQRDLEMTAAISASGAAEMRIFGHSGHRSSACIRSPEKLEERAWSPAARVFAM